ncbi:hypothetical protein CMV_006094 [Castanea mollissima]|uniref:S-protein homolog n=1 Tax=Castanea mollissima TaxID=60419 RepID=A0A8J4RKB3_9ROSI|nr:hypothetical protein CMV_006094 [Castanea mollissima]
MNQMIIAQLYCFVFILLLAFGQSTSSKSTNSIFTHYVRIVNHLNNKPLTYHCKSADDDLGLRTLQPNGEWEFSFDDSAFKTTDFYCYFFNKNLHASFDVFVETGSFEANCGGNHCIWTAQEDGFYLYDMIFDENVKMHDWSK